MFNLCAPLSARMSNWDALSPQERFDLLKASHRPKNPRRGKISLRRGPMFSEKSTWLMLAAFRSIHRNKRVAFLRPKLDTRDVGISGIKTHNGQELLSSDKVIYATVSGATDLEALRTEEWDVALIEEAQFWGLELVDFCLRLSKEGVEVYVAGLSGDINMKPWPTVDAIAAIADFKEDVTAHCKVCEAPAPFTICTTVFTGNVHPGANDYHALCGDCRSKWVNGLEKSS